VTPSAQLPPLMCGSAGVLSMIIDTRPATTSMSAGAARRHVHHVDAGHVFESSARCVEYAAPRGERQLAQFLFRQRDQFGDIFAGRSAARRALVIQAMKRRVPGPSPRRRTCLNWALLIAITPVCGGRGSCSRRRALATASAPMLPDAPRGFRQRPAGRAKCFSNQARKMSIDRPATRNVIFRGLQDRLGIAGKREKQPGQKTPNPPHLQILYEGSTRSASRRIAGHSSRP
jgi:hypothetical protein